MIDSIFATKSYDTEVTVAPVPWVIRDLWQRRKINILFGPEKAGKSRLLNWLIVNMLLAPNVLDMAVDWKPERVLYLAGEERWEEVNARMLRYVSYLGLPPKQHPLPIDFISASGMRLDHLSQRQTLESMILGEGYDMLVIDPLRRVHGADENDNTSMSVILNDFRRWTNQHGVTMVMLHHTGKLSDDVDLDRIASWSRGASDLAAILDTAQFLRRMAANKVILARAGRFKPVPQLRLCDGQDDEYVYKIDNGNCGR